MIDYPLHNINCFREKYPLNNDNERKKETFSLNDNSFLLSNIIKNKELQKNLSKKLFEIHIEKPIIKFENKKVQEKSPYEKKERIIHIPKNESIIKEEKLNNYINNIEISYKNTSNSNINKKKYNHNYNKIPINIYQKDLQSSINANNKSYTLNKNNSVTELDRHILSFRGKKIFANSSFSGLNKKIKKNSPIQNYSNDSELFRNYNELKLKKEEIYKRKIKKNISSEKKQLLTIQKDKEIKDKTIDIMLDNSYKSRSPILYNYYKNNKYINKIPFPKKDNRVNINKNDNIKKTNNKNMKISNTNNNDNISLPKNIAKIMNKYNDFCYSKNNNINNYRTNKSRNYYINTKIDDFSTYKKNIYNNMPKSSQNHYYSYYNINNEMEINKNSNNIRNKNIKCNTINFNSNKKQNPHKKKVVTPEKYINLCNFINSKKKFLEDQLNNIILFSEDRKLTIRIHCLKNIYQEFIFKRKKPPKLHIQKGKNIFISGKIKFYLNYLKNKNISKSTKDMKSLYEIKEEEEKSKAELTKSESQIEELDNSKYFINNRKNNICKMKKMIHMDSLNHICKTIKKN